MRAQPVGDVIRMRNSLLFQADVVCLSATRKESQTVKKRKIVITRFDRERLDELLAVAMAFDYRDREDLKHLVEELKQAQMVEPQKVPPQVVTMNSTVRLKDMESGELDEYTLVFPNEADVGQGKISVISPLGTAILGYSAGSEIVWQMPGGPRKIKVEAVLYQPEASGDFTR